MYPPNDQVTDVPGATCGPPTLDPDIVQA